MSNDLNKQNLLMQNLQNTVLQDSWALEGDSAAIAKQKSKLKEMFVVVDDNNVTASQKKAIITKAQNLKNKISDLEAQMKVLANQIKEKEDLIKDKSEEIADLITTVGSKSDKLKSKTKTHVKNVIDDVFYEYKKGIIKKDEISAEMRRRIQEFGGAERAEIEKILSNLKGMKKEVQGLTDGVTALIDKASLLENKYSLTKSTYELLTATASQIGATDTQYTNSDINTARPIYSLDKADIVSNLADNSKYNVSATNSNYLGASAPTPKTNSLNEVAQKYSNNLNVKATSSDSESITNAATSALQNAMNMGLLDDLAKSGANNNEILEFLANNFASAGIVLTDDNSLSIPNGHGDPAIATYDRLSTFVNSLKSTPFKTDLDVTGKAGNTISSNNQLKALAGNYETILESLGHGNPKFTFKEAMFALFNPDTGLFKDTGITYELNKQQGEPKYSIKGGGDNETAEFYQNFSDKVFEIWGVKATDETYSSTSTRRTGSRVPTPTPAPVVSSSGNTDPLSFRSEDGRENTFIIDRNKDGKFSDIEEFVGAKDGTSWLDDLKSLDKDGNGILEGDELKDLKILQSDYTDNAKTKTQNGFLREETTTIGYSMTNAQSFGIESIDLKGLEENVNKSQGKKDINASDLFNDSFSFKTTDGREYTTQRKDDTSEFMKAVYGDAKGKSFEVGFDEEFVQSILDSNDKAMQKFGVNLDTIRGHLSYLLGFDMLVEETRAIYIEAMEEIERDKNLQLRMADNRAAAMTVNVPGWSDIREEVYKKALNEGLEFDEEQVKGIYTTSAGSAQEVFNEYKELIEEKKAIVEESEILNTSTAILAACVKEGVTARLDDIKALVKDGKITNEKDGVEYFRKK